MSAELLPGDCQTSPRRLAPDALARVAGYASAADQAGALDNEILAWLRTADLWGWNAPVRFGGHGATAWELRLLHEDLGRRCQSTRALVTAHQIVVEIVARWGSRDQQNAWLPQLAKGEVWGAFALSERGGGSDPSTLTAAGVRTADGFRISGTKCWVTNGDCADLVLACVLLEGEPSAVMLRRDAPGVELLPVGPLLGFRAAMVADLELRDLFVSEGDVIGPLGAGLTIMAGSGLDFGRFVTACGAAGMIAQAFRDARRAVQSVREGAIDNPSVRRQLGEIRVALETAQALCERAATLRDAADPQQIDAALLAKYVSVRGASEATRLAVQLMGAAGCRDNGLAARFFRDAKILEIIEGPQDVLEAVIGAMWHDCLE